VVYTEREREVVYAERQREVDHTRRQRELIRTRVDAYQAQHQETRGLTWKGLCDEIFDLTKVHVRDEVLRQWVEEFIAKNRKSSLHPNETELKALTSFLMHPEIEMLSEAELNKPEIPYRFAKFLLDFLAYPGHTQLYPPKELGGRYLAVLKDRDGSIRRRVELTLDVHKRDHVIRVSEASEAWSWGIELDGETGESLPVDQKLEVTYRANGWGVITPEGNLLLFLKNERFGHNHYYFTIALHPDLWSGTPATQFALLRHAYPVPQTPDSRTLPDLMKETDGDTVLLHFEKITETETDI